MRRCWSLIAGLVLIAAVLSLLAVDVHRRGGVIVGETFPNPATLPRPTDALGQAARWAGYNVTPLCWIGYLLVFDGLLTILAHRRGEPSISSLRARPNRFVVAWLTSIPVWCLFDYVNFTHLDAWRYWGMPPEFAQRVAGYFIAFAAISPGMFLAAQWFMHLGVKRVRLDARRWGATLAAGLTFGPLLLIWGWMIALALGRPSPGTSLGWTLAAPLPGVVALLLTRRLEWASLGLGLGFTAWAMLSRDPVGNLGLWVGLIYLGDPIAAWLGGPSILRDWRAGRLGRTLALFAGGALCGLLWEGWNYWALTKWTYHLPFLGSLESYRYFEMPLMGFQGFLPFAVECWVMLNVIVALLVRAGLPVAEALPDETMIL